MKIKLSNRLIINNFNYGKSESIIAKYKEPMILSIAYALGYYERSNLIIINIEALMYVAKIKNNRNNNNFNKIKKCLTILKQEKLINFNFDIERAKKYDMLEIKSNLVNKDNKGNEWGFFTIGREQYNNLIEKGRFNNSNFLVFANLQARMYKRTENESIKDGKYEVCFPTYESILKDIGLNSRKTLSNALGKLKKLNLIRYKNLGKYKDSDNNVKIGNNCYAIYKKGWEDEIDGSLSLLKSKLIENGCKLIV